jgi:hypothetical protein
MRISEVIKELEIMQLAHGDVLVVRYDQRTGNFCEPWVRSVLIAVPLGQHAGSVAPGEPHDMVRCVSVTG